MSKVEEAFGSVDVLVNNAAYVAPFHQFVDGDPAEWEKMVREESLKKFVEKSKFLMTYCPALIFSSFLFKVDIF